MLEMLVGSPHPWPKSHALNGCRGPRLVGGTVLETRSRCHIHETMEISWNCLAWGLGNQELYYWICRQHLNWLVVPCAFYIFPYIGKIHPNWLMVFGVGTTTMFWLPMWYDVCIRWWFMKKVGYSNIAQLWFRRKSSSMTSSCVFTSISDYWSHI